MSKKINEQSTNDIMNVIREKFEENENQIKVLVQGWYGNRTETYIEKEKFDEFFLDYLMNKIDRTIIRFPNSENIVVVYNKYREQRRYEDIKEYLKEKNYIAKPLVDIPELNVKIYGRCVVCRIDNDGKLESLQAGDVSKIIKYLAE